MWLSWRLLFVYEKSPVQEYVPGAVCYEHGDRALVDTAVTVQVGVCAPSASWHSQGPVSGFSVTGSVLFGAHLHLLSATAAAAVHCCLDTRRRHKKESVILGLPGPGEEHSL